MSFSLFTRAPHTDSCEFILIVNLSVAEVLIEEWKSRLKEPLATSGNRMSALLTTNQLMKVVYFARAQQRFITKFKESGDPNGYIIGLM